MKTNLFIKHLVGTVLFFGIIFLCAGHWDYWQGIVYTVAGLIMFILNHTVFQVDEDLAIERSKPSENSKNWDKRILGLSFLCTLAMFAVAGFDSGRYQWSPEFHWSLNLIGLIFTMTGQLLFMMAQKQNKFFSSTVRIQTDRNHTVCEEGLYKLVRHPAYMGSFIQLLGFPLLFGSLWSIIPVGLSLILLVSRTYLEDKTLMNELTGYTAYADKVCFRLFPYIW